MAKIDITNLEAEKSKEVAEIISNKTCRKIIDYLKEKEASETNIAKTLNLPLTTVHYNIQKLLKNGFIEVKNFFWSEKGNKVNIYKASNKVFVFAQKPSKYMENKLRVVLLSLIPALLLLSLFMLTIVFDVFNIKDELYPQEIEIALEKFSSCNELNKAFEEAQSKAGGYGILEGLAKTMAVGEAAEAAVAAPDYSRTTVQVEGVDEADIVKSDGNYIYFVTNKKLVIARAYPEDEAEILSEMQLNFEPQEMFIDENSLLIFGSTYEEAPRPIVQEEEGQAKEQIYPYYPTISLVTVQLWDIKHRTTPQLIKKADFEGSYLTSRKIGSWVYFVVNSWPRYYIMEQEQKNESIIPLYRETTVNENKSLEPTCKCADVQYFEPVDAQSFITLAAMSMQDENAEINKKVIVGSGENVYASLQNLYVAEMNYPHWVYTGLRAGERIEETTIVHKFTLDKENIEYKGNAQAPGHILNQFSMDEYNSYFRIATTKGDFWQGSSTNNIYIFNENLNMTGKVEDLAPGENIYSVRFMGDRGYMVTFKKIDPLFAIDLSDPENPRVLGKLKIPGYSDYLHPYDENHLIGIGKEAVDVETGELLSRDFAWYQGMKIALFDVTDVTNPVEMYKTTIGDRGTDSEALHNHKAFLFSKDKNLLDLPVLLAEIKGDKSTLPPETYGDYVFQGAYVYKLTLEGGFELKGRVTHYDTNESFEKSGYYFFGNSNIQRSLYIDNILYTISASKIMLNSLDDLSMLKELKINVTETEEPIYKVM